MIQRTAGGQRGADRADAVAPGGRAEHDRQAEHGQADAVPAVLGGERFGLVRTGDRAGQPTGAAGEQVPGARADLDRARGGVPGRRTVSEGSDVVALDRLDGQLLRLGDRRQVLGRGGAVHHRRAGGHAASVCSGIGRDRRVGGGIEGAEVDRPGREQVLRELAAGTATGLRLVGDVVVLVVVVVVVLVVGVPEEPVADLAEPFGDLVHRGGGDDQQAEERHQHEQDDGDDRADAGHERRADGPAEQPPEPGPAALGIGVRAEHLGDADHRGASSRTSRSAAGRGTPGAGRCAAAAARRRRGRRARP